jgi:hypothetical protein
MFSKAKAGYRGTNATAKICPDSFSAKQWNGCQLGSCRAGSDGSDGSEGRVSASGASACLGHACHSYTLAEASLSMRHIMCMRRPVAYPKFRMQWRLRKSCSTIMYVPVASGTCPRALWTTAETSNGMPFAQARAIGDEKLNPRNSMWKICSSPMEHACIIWYVPTAPGS